MKFGIGAVALVTLTVTLAGCTGDPSPVAPAAEAVDVYQTIKQACGESLNINSAINTADWEFTTGSIPAEDWLAALRNAKQDAARQAELAADSQYASAIEEYSEMIAGFDETAPTVTPERNWESATSFVQACADANMSYGVGGGGGAVGG